MRVAFQLLVFLAYVGAMGWGSWYVFSGTMIADREARQAAETPTPPAADPTDETEGDVPPGDELETGSGNDAPSP